MPGSTSVQRILVVDDDPLIRKLLHTTLTHDQHEVRLCEDSQAALEALDGGDYTLVITDLVMPHRTGIGLIEALRARGEEVPVILMSGTLDEGVREICSAFGRVHLIPKPFGLAELRAAVEAAASHAGTLGCPKCKRSNYLIRIGNPVTRWCRRLVGRNLYACQSCRIYWRAREWDGTVPVKGGITTRRWP